MQDLQSKKGGGNNFFETSSLGKNLPISIEAEKSVLASILLNDENFSLISDILSSEDFYLKSHQAIFQTITDLSQKNKKIDLLTLQDELEKKGALASSGGIEYLIELQENIPAIGFIVQHANIVKEKRILRDLINSASEILTACYSQKEDEIEYVLDSAEKKIFQITSKKTASTFVQLDVWLKKTFQHLANVRGQREGITGVPTGFAKLDEMTSGMQRGDLLILAARPSMGKTTLAMNMVVNAAKQGSAVAVFSLEMSAEQLVLRMLSSESGISHQRIRNAMITSDEWVELTNTAARLAEYPIYIDDTPSLSIMELRAKARKLKARSDIKFVAIDYLQLIRGNTRYENRTQEISEISRSLKALSKELNVPVLALSQLSRQLESRMDKRPILSDLRESGAIEQDGDVIMFVYRDVIYNQDTETPDLAEVIIGKQRNGPVGSCYVRFSGETTTFIDLTGDEI
ncbi:MAG: Replicative DNA helicase [candidate division TM6 bacterium GW2011_GWE2_31_21]|nr:MAG: Replicative DNA helicase [candidate division TM6 bacterium GW2011_GWE2_31_21]KKP53610.1 MAG: Replicative DNA helicase [candidate division TM6 bacterium GW2011_GWF2_33_332]